MTDVNSDDEFAEIDTTVAEFDAMWARAVPVDDEPRARWTVNYFDGVTYGSSQGRVLGLQVVGAIETSEFSRQ